MPTDTHQTILAFLHALFRAWIRPRGGVAVFSDFGCGYAKANTASPTWCSLLDRSDPRRQDRYWLGADLVTEVVSPDAPERDLVDKRADYAEAVVPPEYWIVDPRDETITVLALQGEAYAEHGVHARGDAAASALLEGFAADVSAVFDAPSRGA